MKVFWAILLGLFMIASAIVFTRSPEAPRPAPESSSPSTPMQQPAQPTASRDEPSEAIPAPQDDPQPADQAISDAGLDATDPVPTDPDDQPVARLDLDELLGIEEEPNRITPEMAIAESAANVEGPRTLSQMATEDFAELALQASGSVEEASEIANAISPDDAIETSEDALVIGRVTIPGSGTEADPYELPWGVLISAIRTYNPRLEMTDLPAWADALNGKHVRITGFAFLPVVASETEEILLMLNPWDGCHMGAPPTPYDSIEVMLDEPVNMGARNGFVTATGQFNVDPFLVRGWLVSLYTMDEARLEFAGS